MEALDLYKFVHNNEIEYHWHDDDVILMINYYLLDDWNKLLGTGITDEDGISCVMKDGYFCFMMQDICDYFGIEILSIFEKNK